MDEQIRAALLTLDFVESVKVDKIPKMKTITKKYHKLAPTHHPDKPGKDGEIVKEIRMVLFLKKRWQGKLFMNFRSLISSKT